jgi:hypothetical protein
MLECFLLVHRAGAIWVPLVAIPAVIAGWVATFSLMLSGIKGIILARASKRNAGPAASPGRHVKWIGTRPQNTEQEHALGRILIALPPPLP